MSDDQQSDVRWVPIEPKPKNTARTWIIVGLVLAAVAIVGAVLFFVLPRDGSAAPEETASPSPSASATAIPSPTSEPEPEPTTPVDTPPPVPDPSIDTFREQVRLWLDDAPVGLQIVSQSSGDEAIAVIETLQADAQRLAGSAAPSSIESQWYAAVNAYSEHLDDLRVAVAAGSGADSALTAASDDADILREMVGL